MNDFNPRLYLAHFMRTWWLIVAAMVAGAAAGAFFDRFQPPIYETSLVFTITINHEATGPLTEREGDQILSAAAGRLTSLPVLRKVIAQAAENGLVIDEGQFRQQLVRERKNDEWIVYIRAEDPGTAELLAGLLAENGLAGLQQAQAAALESRALQAQLESYLVCQAAQQDCGLAAGSLEEAITSTTQALDKANRLSRGINPDIFFGLSGEAGPARVTAFERSALAFAGALIGLVLALWAVQWLFGRSETHEDPLA